MNTERAATIKIGDEEYVLILTTRATKEIAGRYGGLEKLGDKLTYASKIAKNAIVIGEDEAKSHSYKTKNFATGETTDLDI